MSVQSFSGIAGSGKTHQLMLALSKYLAEVPLRDGQNVLALTFMHGSRRRLNERLGRLVDFGQRYECSTVDSFVARVVRRWQALSVELGLPNPDPTQYDELCVVAARLLQDDSVVGWVAAKFPVLILDEAQDLSPVRLEVIKALARRVELIAAFDEFQCLDEGLTSNPACNWLAKTAVELTVPRRTTIKPLLDAAAAIRSAASPVSNGVLKIQLAPNVPLAGTFVANEIGWHGLQGVAIITPSMGTYAQKVLEWVAQKTTKKGNGPFAVDVEKSERVAANEFVSALDIPTALTLDAAYAIVAERQDARIAVDISKWLDTQRRVRGKSFIEGVELEAAVRRSFANGRWNTRYGRYQAMTVHGAKNREFDVVIVLWPAAIKGSEAHKRRLLYNAITRAKKRCLVLVQSDASLKAPPF